MFGLVTRTSSSSGSAAIDKTEYGGRYDFGEGGKTPDGKVLIRKAVRTLMHLYEQIFHKPFVVDNVISHARAPAWNWPKLVHKAPSFFEARYRFATATGKACTKDQISVHIFWRLSRIQENPKIGKDMQLVEPIADISKHGDEPIALLPEPEA